MNVITSLLRLFGYQPACQTFHPWTPNDALGCQDCGMPKALHPVPRDWSEAARYQRLEDYGRKRG